MKYPGTGRGQLQNRFYTKEKAAVKPVSFIKADQNVYYSRSRLPGKFPFGTPFQFLLLIGAILLTYREANKSFYDLDKQSIDTLTEEFDKINNEIGSDKKRKIEVNKGEIKAVEASTPLVKDLLYALLSGKNDRFIKRGFKGNVRIHNRDILAHKNTVDFLYVCRYTDLPQDIITKHVFSFFAEIQGLDRQQKEMIIQAMGLQGILAKKINLLTDEERVILQSAIPSIKPSSLYLFYETICGMPAKLGYLLLQKLKELTKDGSSALYLSSNLMVREISREGNGFGECPLWFEQLETLGNKK
jgi:hypothetical protein